MKTVGKRLFDPFNLRKRDINIKDIAHSLSMQCRFVGHVHTFYSVAEHSVRVSWYAEECGMDRKNILTALMHDAQEAYINDLARPIKNAKGFEAYRKMEDAACKVISDKYGLIYPLPYSICEIDRGVIFATEVRDLMNGNHGFEKLPSPLKEEIVPLSQSAAKWWFLHEFEKFGGK